MLEELTGSPVVALAFIIMVIYLAAVYLTRREKTKIHDLKGGGRFQPDWRRSRHSGGRRRKRTRRRGGNFEPHWSRRSSGGEPSAKSTEDTAIDPEADRIDET